MPSNAAPMEDQYNEDGHLAASEAGIDQPMECETYPSPCTTVPLESFGSSCTARSGSEPLACPAGLSSHMKLNGLCHLPIKNRPQLIAVGLFEKGRPRTMRDSACVNSEGLPFVLRREENLEDLSHTYHPSPTTSPSLRISLAEYLRKREDDETTSGYSSPNYVGRSATDNTGGSRQSSPAHQRSSSPNRALLSSGPGPIDVMAHAPTLFNCPGSWMRMSSSLPRRINYSASKIHSSRRIGECAENLARGIQLPTTTSNTPLLVSKVIWSTLAQETEGDFDSWTEIDE